MTNINKDWSRKTSLLVNTKVFILLYNHNNSIWGRCGGGWKFVLSIKLGSSEILIELNWITIKIMPLFWRKKK